jgi:hypothetical protein
MTISAVFFTTPSAVVTHESGRQYTAASSGLLTVAFPDGQSTAGNIGAVLPVLWLTGTTTDRLTLSPSGANQGQLQSGDPHTLFNDTTLSAFCAYVGTALGGASGWISQTGTTNV